MAITTRVSKYSKPHGGTGGSGGGYRGSITQGDLPGDIVTANIDSETGYIRDLSGDTLNYNEGTFLYLFSEDGTINRLTGEGLDYKEGWIGSLTADEISAKTIKGKELNIDGKGWIEELNSKYITTEYLTVTKQAHFFELIIDKVRSVGGTLIMTQANSIIDYAKAVDAQGNYLAALDDPTAAAYDVFWLARDKNTGRNVTNDWIVGDQAYCQSFNNVSAGVNYDVSNKYYWRLVKSILADRYMNIRTGAELPASETQLATKNTVNINTPKVMFEIGGQEKTIDEDWNTIAQTIDGIITGVTWAQTSGGAGSPTIGTMSTTNTVFGIQLQPIADSDLSKAVPETFRLECSKARLNIGIYYTDESSEYFPAPEVATTNYEYILKKVKNTEPAPAPEYISSNTYPIKAVVITNADEVEWQLVHGIRLSNDYANDECDEMLVDTASIPSIGDNIAQLGYRWTGSSDPNEKSRGNAIIIAAYKTPDNGTGIQDDLNQWPIKPPSYAQYEAIASDSAHRFDLAHYRRTYMDANGSTFRGDFYTGGGTSIVDMIEQGEADMYQLFTAYCDSLNESQYILYPNANWNWAKSSNMPGGRAWQFMGNVSKPITIQQGETAEQAMARVEATLQFSDYKWIELAAGSGTPGGHWENCYKNTQDAVNPPAPPNVNGVPKRVDQLPYNNWYAEPQTLPAGYYTWMSQAFVNGAGAYQEWQTAVRLTGADGKDGEDGNDIEFIYTRNNGDVDGDPLTPSAPPNGHTYRDDWPSTYNSQGQKTSDHETDSNGVTWYDNPQGVSADMKYEYMCQRIKRNGSWTDYSSPVVWSNWGVKGQDGDGYEYIYKHFNSVQTWADDDTNPAHWSSSSGVDSRGHYFDDDEYLGPVSQGWSDDPVGVSETLQFEYCATRKKKDGVWEKFSTPTVWAHWAPPGTAGPEGPQGPQGAAGDSATGYILVDKGSKAGYDLTLNSDNEIVADFAVSLKFQVARSTGDGPEILTCNQVTELDLGVYALFTKSTLPSSTKTWYKFSPASSGSTEKTFELTYSPASGATTAAKQNFIDNNPNFLVALVPSTASTLSENASAIANLKYEVSVPFVVGTGAIEKIVKRDKDGHASYMNLVTNVEENTNNINTISSNVSGIQSQVTQLNQNVGTLGGVVQGMQGTLNVQANQISSMVEEIDNISDVVFGDPVMVDLTGLDESSFYPCSISLQRNRIYYQRIRVSRWLDSAHFGSPPGWSTHTRGFTVELEWNTIGCGWGTTYSASHPELNPRFVINFNVSFTKKVGNIPKEYVAGTIGQQPYGSKNNNSKGWSDEIVYLRGGSKYYIETDWPESVIELWPSGYTYSITSSIGETMTYDAPVIDYTSFVLHETDTMNRSEIVQTAESISLGVVEQNAVTGEQLRRTGIDITRGTITLNANNTEIVGNLNLRETTNGLTVFDGSGNPRINIHPETIRDKTDMGAVKIEGILNANSTTSSSVSFTTNDTYPAATLGKYKRGAVLQTTGLYFNASYGNANKWNGTIYFTVRIYHGATTSTSFSGSGSANTHIALDDVFTVAIPSETTYKIEVSYSCTNNTGKTFYCQPTYYMTIQTPSVTDMGYDGLAVRHGVDKYSYFSPTLTELRYEDSGIRLNSETSSYNTPQQFIGESSSSGAECWVSVGSIQRMAEVSSGTWAFGSHPSVEIVLCKGSGCTIQLPGDTTGTAYYWFNNENDKVDVPVGTIKYIKGYSNTTVQCKGRKIVRPSDPYENTSVTNFDSLSIGSGLWMFIYTGDGVWLSGKINP